MGEASHQRLAIERLELVEPRAVDEPGDDLAHRARAGAGRPRRRHTGPAGSTAGRLGSRRSQGGAGGRRLRLATIDRPSASACSSSSASWSATPERRVWTSAPPSSSARDVLAGRGLHERRSAQEDRARALDDDGLVAHRRDVGATGRATAHDQRDLRDARGRHPGLVVEDPAEMVAVGEDVRLEREERPAAVDEVDARQAVLEGDLLGPQVLLDGHRVVGAALDGRVVGDDHAGRALDAADAGDDAGARAHRRRRGRSAASGLSSRNAEPGSIRRSMRSRTGSLPRSRWRAIERSSPPAPRPATVACRSRSSATRPAMAS